MDARLAKLEKAHLMLKKIAEEQDFGFTRYTGKKGGSLQAISPLALVLTGLYYRSSNNTAQF